jgi:hypothetical protein
LIAGIHRRAVGIAAAMAATTPAATTATRRLIAIGIAFGSWRYRGLFAG